MAERLLRRVFPVICILANGICTVICYGISFPAVFVWILCYILGSEIHMALHETGHLLGGLCSGYKLVFWQAGSVRLISSGEGKRSLQIRKERSGQCVMAPRSLQKIRYLWYNAGGMLLNALACACALALWRSGSGYESLFFLQLFFAGLPKLYANCIPCLQNGSPNDGYILRLLSRNPACRKDYGTYLYVYARRFWGVPFRAGDYRYERTAAGKDTDRIYYEALQELLEEEEKRDG